MPDCTCTKAIVVDDGCPLHGNRSLAATLQATNEKILESFRRDFNSGTADETATTIFEQLCEYVELLHKALCANYEARCQGYRHGLSDALLETERCWRGTPVDQPAKGHLEIAEAIRRMLEGHDAA